MKHILFLCTGNYYRSRFAECLFNHLARETGLKGWHADSCGLRVQPDGVVNVGPISCFTLEGLAARGIKTEHPLRMPRQVTEPELRSAARVIALKEMEHRPLMERLHPEFANTVIYWHVHDLDAALPTEALAAIENRVRGLVDELLHDQQATSPRLPTHPPAASQNAQLATEPSGVHTP